MNYAVIRRILGKIMVLIGCLMFFPMLIAIIYKETLRNILAFAIPMVSLITIGKLISFKKETETNKMSAREGIIIVGITWIMLALFGSIPLMISKEIPNFFNAFFEMSSGFTTTGASIVEDVTKLSHSILFWRSFSHWIGGMGVLVFILAIIPESKEGSSMHLLKAESPGPQVGKMVSKMQITSRILYLIYFCLTVIMIALLWLGPDDKMNFFNSTVYSLGTAGTGGFAVDPDGLASYAAYSQYVIAGGMLVFGINFSLFYLILIKKAKEAFKNEELRLYLAIVVISVVTIFATVYSTFNNIEEAFRHSLFQVATIVSTTGYATYDFIQWPTLALGILFILMFSGGCAGSTAGGMKVTRLGILFKSSIRKVKNEVSPRKVEMVSVDGKALNDSVIESVQSYFVLYMFIAVICAVIYSFDGFDLLTNFTASITCLSNVGPGLTAVIGPMGNFAGFSNFSKLLMAFEMIAGRLELFPILILFNPKTWRKGM